MALGQNQPPATPVVTEPRVGRVVNPSDCHMETDVFTDPNPGDAHVCTDWQIVQASDGQVVWTTACITGVERLHTHLGDGVFSGPLAGANELAPQTNYRLRVRFRDSSGQTATEWSAWGERDFVTGTLSAVFPMEIQDVLSLPAPVLSEPLPGGAVPATVRLGDSTGQLLLQVTGSGTGNVVSNPPSLGEHGAAKATVTAGSAGLTLPEFELNFTDEDDQAREIVFPAVDLMPGESESFWISTNGSTYHAHAEDTVPSFAELVRGASVPWTAAADIKIERVATGFQMPVGIAFVPNPSADADAPIYYVAELYGTIKVVKRDGTVADYATDLLNYDPSGAFPGSGEQGVGGLTVDPTNGDVFATVLFAPDINNNSVGNPRVVRLSSANGGRTSNARTIILNMAPEVQGQSHQISNITIGPDGFLYVHMGDGFDAGSAQNLSFYRGKILRLLRTGQPAPGNPFYNILDGITARDYVYASGVRNPFGGAWRASDSSHYFVENGPSVDRFAKLVAGRNYLWNGSDASMTNFALYNWDPASAPVNITFVQAETFGGSGFPAAYFGRAYVTQSGPTWASGPGSAYYKSVTEWTIDGAGVLVGQPRAIAYYNGGGKSTTVAIAAGPDGLYFSDFYKEDSFADPTARGSSIFRARYQAPPPPPDCNGNSVPDATDIAAGTSLDCNLNAIPDECDIAAGRSQDCNNNTVPDECDTTTLATETFGGGLNGWQVNGVAQLTNGFVRLTTTAGGVVGSLVHAPLSADPTESFDIGFDFRIGGGSGADGMSFAVFDASRYTQSALFSEEGPGSGNEAPSGPGTVVVQFDTYDNDGEGENTIEIMTDGVTRGTYVPSFDLEDNQWHRATVVFDGEHLTVRVTNAAGVIETAFNRLPIPYTPFVGRFGFGGRTGGLTNNHDIDNVSFRVPGPNDLNGDGIPDVCECPSNWNHDDTVDGDDVIAFFGEWDSNNADINGDGGTDGDDVIFFFAAWDAGC